MTILKNLVFLSVFFGCFSFAHAGFNCQNKGLFQVILGTAFLAEKPFGVECNTCLSKICGNKNLNKHFCDIKDKKVLIKEVSSMRIIGQKCPKDNLGKLVSYLPNPNANLATTHCSGINNQNKKCNIKYPTRSDAFPASTDGICSTVEDSRCLIMAHEMFHSVDYFDADGHDTTLVCGGDTNDCEDSIDCKNKELPQACNRNGVAQTELEATRRQNQAAAEFGSCCIKSTYNGCPVPDYDKYIPPNKKGKVRVCNPPNDFLVAFQGSMNEQNSMSSPTKTTPLKIPNKAYLVSTGQNVYDSGEIKSQLKPSRDAKARVIIRVHPIGWNNNGHPKGYKIKGQLNAYHNFPYKGDNLATGWSFGGRVDIYTSRKVKSISRTNDANVSVSEVIDKIISHGGSESIYDGGHPSLSVRAVVNRLGSKGEPPTSDEKSWSNTTGDIQITGTKWAGFASISKEFALETGLDESKKYWTLPPLLSAGFGWRQNAIWGWGKKEMKGQFEITIKFED